MATIEKLVEEGVQQQVWAFGCPKCKYGLVSAPAYHAAIPLFEERVLQAAANELALCDCRAGHMYRQFLRRHYQAMSEPYRAMLRGKIDAAQAGDGSLPRILSQGDGVPTMHYEGEGVEA